MKNDFEFAFEGAASPNGPWMHLQVVKFEGKEQVSGLFRYDLVVVAKAPATELDPHELVMARATLRIKTLTAPSYRVVHGVIVEAEEVTSLPDGMLYRVVMMPPIVRATHRRRCRVFLDKTLRQIVETVLAGEPLLTKLVDGQVMDEDGSPIYVPARETYTWRVAASPRLDDAKVRAYTVQYNESDYAFLARLLEEEGISFHYEHGNEQSMLVFADGDAGRWRVTPFIPLTNNANSQGREVTGMKLGSRLRAKSLVIDDYNWKNPPASMQAEVKQELGGANQGPMLATLSEYSYPGGYPDAPGQGAPLVQAQLERYGVEASWASGEAYTRILSAGSIFALEHSKARYEGEYLVTKLEVVGHQAGVLSQSSPQNQIPYASRFELARRGKDGAIEDSRFRPARTTPKPRIVGTQTAFVTAEPTTPGAEIHVGGPPQGEIGCVRLRFHWDHETTRLAKEPSSCWVRVSQMFAGGNEGAVWHPRVGVEVVVDFEEGDPDRPLVVGRVYNGQRLPPAPSVGSPTISTFKSFSSPGGGKYNEFMFDDAAGAEEIKLHAARDWNNEVGNDRTEVIAHDSSSNVGDNRSEETGNNRTTTVGVNNAEVVGANETIAVGVNQSTMVGANQSLLVGANQSNNIGADQSTNIGAARTTNVGAADTLEVGAAQTITVGAGQTVTVGGGGQTFTISGAQSFTVSGPQTMTSSVMQTSTAPAQTWNGVAQTFNGVVHSTNAVASHSVNTTTASVNGKGSITLKSGGSSIELTPGGIVIKSGNVTIQDGAINVTGGVIDMSSASTVKVTGGAPVNIAGPVVKLN